MKLPTLKWLRRPEKMPDHSPFDAAMILARIEANTAEWRATKDTRRQKALVEENRALRMAILRRGRAP